MLPWSERDEARLAGSMQPRKLGMNRFTDYPDVDARLLLHRLTRGRPYVDLCEAHQLDGRVPMYER